MAENENITGRPDLLVVVEPYYPVGLAVVTELVQLEYPHSDAVAVDARHTVTTGISAADRARTLQVLTGPASCPGDVIRPGHVIPERAEAGGPGGRYGRVEAAVELAWLPSVGVLGELVGETGEVLSWSASSAFARAHGLALQSIPSTTE